MSIRLQTKRCHGTKCGDPFMRIPNIILDNKLLILSSLILCLVLGKLKGKENREKNIRKEKCKKIL